MALSKPLLISVVVFFLNVPAVVLVVQSFDDEKRCDRGRVTCDGKCAVKFAVNQEKSQFQSQREPERQCYRSCLNASEACKSAAASLIIAACILGVGIVLTTAMIFLVDSLITKEGTVQTPPPRAAYMEPIYTESEKRKMRRGSNTPNDEVELVEVKCPSCNISVDVESRWFTMSCGGTDGAVCLKCKQVIVGVL